MTQSQTGIKVNNLPTSQSLTSDNMLMALTDNANNTVSLISLENLENSLVSSTANNGLSNDENGLYVPNIGNLADLDTTDKTSIVSAINENVNRINQPITVLATSGTIALTDNSINSITPTASVTFALPTVTDNTIFHQILVQAKLTNNVYISPDRIGTSHYFYDESPTFAAIGAYNIVYEYDSVNNFWVVGSVYKGNV